MFDITWCDKYDRSVLCLLYFKNSLISREHLPHLTFMKKKYFSPFIKKKYFLPFTLPSECVIKAWKHE